MIRLTILSLFIVNVLFSCSSPVSVKKDKEPVDILWTKDVPAKHEILNGSAFTYEDMIYVLAGKQGRLMKYNPANYTWLDLAGLPSPRTETGASLWNDRIVVAGGVDDSSRFSNRVDYYDLKLQVWKEMPPLPEPSCRMTLNVQDGLLSLSFGVCGTHDQSYNNCLEVFQYSDSTRTWNGKAKLTSGRFGHIGVTKDNRLFIIGGYGYDKKVGTFYIDHSKKEFGFKNDIPQSRGNFGGALVGDYILTFGGKVQGANSPMEKYNIITDKWESIGNCPFWNDRFASTRWHDRIYVFGGSQNPMGVWKGDIIFKKD